MAKQPKRVSLKRYQQKWPQPRGLNILRQRWEKYLYDEGRRSTEGLTLPDFLGIGAQKAGTTWLYFNLARHPEIHVATKEVHYFDRQMEHWSIRHYARFLRGGKGLVKGEITPTYCALPLETVQFIRRIMPDVRLIFLLRNPVDRAWSSAMHTFLKGQKRQIEDVSERELLSHFRNRGRELGDYVGALETWEKVFPQEQLLVGFYEDLTLRPEGLMQDVFRHLGVSEVTDWSGYPLREVANKGLGKKMPEKYRAILEEIYARDIELLYQRFGARVEAWRCTPEVKAARERQAVAV